MRPFVAIIPFASKDEIYLVKQLRYTIKRFSWEIPQGFVENKETALQAAKRELAEEAGFKAKRWENLGFTYLAVGHTNQKFFIFTAEGLTKIGKKLAGGEIDEVKKVSLTKVNEMLLRNQIETVTMASLFKFEKTITN
jgi:ADP-ribose pyrophosphatase